MNVRWLRLRCLPLYAVLALLVPGCKPNSTAVATPTVATAGTSISDEELLKRLDEVLDHTYAKRRLNLEDHAAWQIIHGAVAFKRDFLVNDKSGNVVPAISHVLAGRPMRGWTFVRGDKFEDRHGLKSIVESGSVVGQGHPDQWLGYLAEAGLAPDQVVIYDGQRYTISDIVRQVEWDVPLNASREYSWTLMGLTTYRPTTHRWVARDGEEWTIEQLVEIEAEQDPNMSACGGAHRLGALAMALARHQMVLAKAEGIEPEKVRFDGAWVKADQRIKEFIEIARRTQNEDGSFSSNFFSRPGTTKDLAQDVRATGHLFEFLMLAMRDVEIKQPWVRRAAVHQVNVLRKAKSVDFECGALYHGVHGLLLYRERIFGPRTFRQLVPELQEVPIPE